MCDFPGHQKVIVTNPHHTTVTLPQPHGMPFIQPAQRYVVMGRYHHMVPLSYIYVGTVSPVLFLLRLPILLCVHMNNIACLRVCLLTEPPWLVTFKLPTCNTQQHKSKYYRMVKDAFGLQYTLVAGLDECHQSTGQVHH